MPPDTLYSAAVENYVKNLFMLQETGGLVTTSLLSEKLQVAPATTTDMLKRLADDGIITYQKYKGSQLTEKGNRLALTILRRHRLWELFLHEVLHFEWHELHEEAERLEHATSTALEQKLDDFLGHPTIDPHGHVIPDADGRFANCEYRRLADIDTSCRIVIRRVNDDSAQVLQYASTLGIAIGKELLVKERIAFDGSLRVQIDNQEQLISNKLAACIFIEEC